MFDLAKQASLFKISTKRLTFRYLIITLLVFNKRNYAHDAGWN